MINTFVSLLDSHFYRELYTISGNFINLKLSHTITKITMIKRIYAQYNAHNAAVTGIFATGRRIYLP